MAGLSRREFERLPDDHPATGPFDDYDTYRAAGERYCRECGQPLGATTDRCHGCGGPSTRPTPRIGNDGWRILLGA
jgi:hypothetical protein